MAPYTHEEFLRFQREARNPVLTADLTGRVVIVVGANVGLGFEASKHFARMNPAKLIMACRDQAKGDAALEQLTEETGFTRAEVWIIDLASFDSVKKFADRASQALEGIDFLVENAGVATFQHEVTPDGFERVIQTNVLGPELLAFLLLPKLLETAKKFSILPRLVVVASGNHYWTKLSDEILNAPNIHKKLAHREYSAQAEALDQWQYPISKLLNVFFARNFATHLPKSDPTILALSVDPGFCLTELRRYYVDNPPTPEVAQRLSALEKDAFTSEEGSRHIVFASLFELGNKVEEEKLQGQYFAPSQLREPSDFVVGEVGKGVAVRLWDETVDILKEVDERVGEIMDKFMSAK